MENSPWIRRCPFSSCTVLLWLPVRICLPSCRCQVTVGWGEPRAVQGRLTFSPMLAITSTGASENNGPTVNRGESLTLYTFWRQRQLCVGTMEWRLTSNLQADWASSRPSRAAGHTSVVTSIDLLHPSNVKGPVANVSPSKWCGRHLNLTWEHTQKVLMCVSSVSCVNCVDLDSPLNQRTRGGGAPEARHSSTASAPTDTWTDCWGTVILGASGGKPYILSFSITRHTSTSHKSLKICLEWDEVRPWLDPWFTWKCEWHRSWGSPDPVSCQTCVIPSIFWLGPFYGQNSILVYSHPVKIMSVDYCNGMYKSKKTPMHVLFWSSLFHHHRLFSWALSVLHRHIKFLWFWGNTFQSVGLNLYGDGNKMWQKHM